MLRERQMRQLNTAERLRFSFLQCSSSWPRHGPRCQADKVYSVTLHTVPCKLQYENFESQLLIDELFRALAMKSLLHHREDVVLSEENPAS